MGKFLHCYRRDNFAASGSRLQRRCMHRRCRCALLKPMQLLGSYGDAGRVPRKFTVTRNYPLSRLMLEQIDALQPACCKLARLSPAAARVLLASWYKNESSQLTRILATRDLNDAQQRCPTVWRRPRRHRRLPSASNNNISLSSVGRAISMAAVLNGGLRRPTSSPTAGVA